MDLNTQCKLYIKWTSAIKIRKQSKCEGRKTRELLVLSFRLTTMQVFIWFDGKFCGWPLCHFEWISAWSNFALRVFFPGKVTCCCFFREKMMERLFLPRFQSDRTNLGHLECFLFFWVHHNHHHVSRIFLQVSMKAELQNVIDPCICVKKVTKSRNIGDFWVHHNHHHWLKRVQNLFTGFGSTFRPKKLFKYQSLEFRELILGLNFAQYSSNPSRIFSSNLRYHNHSNNDQL